MPRDELHDERTEATTEQQFIASELAQLQAAIVADRSCMQLFVSDALETLESHPTTDAGENKLAEEYAHLCPKQVAGFHLHERAKP